MTRISDALVALMATSAMVVSATAAADVSFVGLDAAQETNARALMPIASADCDSAPWRVERLFRDADQNLRRSLEALGYYDVTIEKNLTRDDDCWHARFDVQTGEPVRLRNVNINIDGEANDDARYLTLAANNRPAPGDILHHGRYEQYKSSLLRAAIGRGFFEAEFSRSEIVVERAAKVADLNLRLTSGPRYHFGQVQFEGGFLRDDLLHGYTDIQPGDPYDASAINEMYEVLSGSSYFKTVTIDTDPVDEDSKTVPVIVSLTPGTRRIYSIGAGYATDTGPQARLGYSNRRRNDKGHQLESRLYWSSVNSELSASYRWPHGDPRHDWVSVVTGVQHEDTETSDSDKYKIGINRSRSLSPTWLQTHYIDYEFEKFKVGDQDTSSKLLIFGMNYESAIGRELIRVDNGRHWNVDIRGAADSLGSDTSFVQLRARAKYIHSFGVRTRVLLRANLGVTAKDEFEDLPASVRFFAGGDRSVRGYEYESLGPTDSNGLVIGGSNILDGSLEFDFALTERWSIATFVDSGSAFNGTDVDFSTGAGLGVRWYSPIGPVRLDLAHPFDNPDQKIRIHINLGPDL
jgi:translocation and assembly module TamA